MYLLQGAEMMIDLRPGNDRNQLMVVRDIEDIPAFFLITGIHIVRRLDEEYDLEREVPERN